jgi:hypothetical protein
LPVLLLRRAQLLVRGQVRDNQVPHARPMARDAALGAAPHHEGEIVVTAEPLILRSIA